MDVLGTPALLVTYTDPNNVSSRSFEIALSRICTVRGKPCCLDPRQISLEVGANGIGPGSAARGCHCAGASSLDQSPTAWGAISSRLARRDCVCSYSNNLI